MAVNLPVQIPLRDQILIILGSNVRQDATVFLTLSMLGGAKKRKKKTYTKPKKGKHKKKKVG